MKTALIAAAVALLTCGTAALGATTSPAIPTRISLSGSGAPRCTLLPVHVDHSWPEIAVVIRNPKTPGAFIAIAARYQAEGTGWYRWCGRYRDHGRPGGYTWYACLGPTALDHTSNTVRCTARTPKRWLAVTA
jgi:hypothetical protein